MSRRWGPETLTYAECPMCARWGQLECAQDWTLYVHHDERVVHMVPLAPPAGTAAATMCPDCTIGFNARLTARLIGDRVVSHAALRPCLRCRTRGCVPGFVMPV